MVAWNLYDSILFDPPQREVIMFTRVHCGNTENMKISTSLLISARIPLPHILWYSMCFETLRAHKKEWNLFIRFCVRWRIHERACVLQYMCIVYGIWHTHTYCPVSKTTSNDWNRQNHLVFVYRTQIMRNATGGERMILLSYEGMCTYDPRLADDGLMLMFFHPNQYVSVCDGDWEERPSMQRMRCAQPVENQRQTSSMHVIEYEWTLLSSIFLSATHRLGCFFHLQNIPIGCTIWCVVCAEWIQSIHLSILL